MPTPEENAATFDDIMNGGCPANEDYLNTADPDTTEVTDQVRALTRLTSAMLHQYYGRYDDTQGI